MSTNFKFFSTVLATLFSVAAMPSGASALIVNDNALLSSGTDVTLNAGTYTVELVGTSAGGAYNAWSPWSVNAGCVDANNCANGFTDRFTISINGIIAQYFLNTGSVTGTGYFETDTGSLTAYQTAYSSAGLSQQVNGAGPVTTAPDPITFTLTAQTVVNFNVADGNQNGDNRGGVSLSVTSGVPELSTWSCF